MDRAENKFTLQRNFVGEYFIDLFPSFCFIRLEIFAYIRSSRTSSLISHLRSLMSTMFSFKLPVVAAIIQLVQAQQSSLEYVNIAAGENSLTFIHPETPAGIGDGTCSSLFFTPVVVRCLCRKLGISSTISTFDLTLNEIGTLNTF
jgi:hypothetical protein